jgi:hypothetical protein
VLSRLASEFAAEIRHHDWSDAHIRADRAGHARGMDSHYAEAGDSLTPEQTNRVRVNVMWVTAQVLGHRDPNFDVVEFAKECGVSGFSQATLHSGLRREKGGVYAAPGTWNLGG